MIQGGLPVVPLTTALNWGSTYPACFHNTRRQGRWKGETLHSRRHRQVPKMSRLSKIHIVILIVVFLVRCIQAADSEIAKKKMRKLSSYLLGRRVTRVTEKTTNAQNNHDYESLCTSMNRLQHSLVVRRNYVPQNSPLTLDELSRAPAPGDSRERLNCVMEYNACQYEFCESMRFRILNAQGLPLDQNRYDIKKDSRSLAEMMKHYLSLEVLYAVALGEVAPHLQPILNPEGERSYENARTTLVNELRAERARIVGLINGIRANPTSVSVDDAVAPVSIQSGRPSLLSPEELSMEPTPNITDDWLHYIMEYNALESERSTKYKRKRWDADKAKRGELDRVLEGIVKMVGESMGHKLSGGKQVIVAIGMGGLAPTSLATLCLP
ncbi:hypothetical protein SeLEV6574_g08515, partial [Synchytrium endobioticum]